MKDLALCAGCQENFYNGNNPMGIKVCWNLEDSKVVRRKFVPMSMRPPWDLPSEKTRDCHRRKGYVAVRQDLADVFEELEREPRRPGWYDRFHSPELISKHRA